MKAPPSDHHVFDELCAGLGDWEPMLAAPFAPPMDLEFEPEDHEEQDSGAIDELILAGLVTPY
jgi:hypothetical protein